MQRGRILAPVAIILALIALWLVAGDERRIADPAPVEVRRPDDTQVRVDAQEPAPEESPDSQSGELEVAQSAPISPEFGIAFYCWFRGLFGLAVGCRSFLRTLVEAGVRVRACDAHTIVRTPHRESNETWQALLSDLRAKGGDVVEIDCKRPHGYFVSLSGIALDLLDKVWSTATSPEFSPVKDSLAIAWIPLETEEIAWNQLVKMPLLDGIWAHSEWVAQTFRRWTELPVRTVWEAVNPEFVDDAPNAAQISKDRTTWGFKNDEFVFLFTFDCYSWVFRKNPQALVRAFQMAFRKNDTARSDRIRKPRLFIKGSNCNANMPGYSEFAAFASGDPRITVNTSVLPSAAVASLMRAADAYVSLHRSEGVGLGMYQMLALGKPVIATNYSGNLDFCKPAHSYLVPVGPRKPGNGTMADPGWPEPDVKVTARYLKEIFDDPVAAKQVGKRAREFILKERSHAKSGENAMAALRELWDNREGLWTWKRMRLSSTVN